MRTITRQLRQRGLTALALTGAFCSGLSAQSTPTSNPEQADEVLKLDAFTVTGTNIRRVDEESTLPVTIIDADDLAAIGASTPVELFENLAIGGALTLTETNVLGADAGGDNTALNLRGIGSGNTLVLLNGRRMAPHPISQSEGGVPSLAVNINQLPTAAIGQVEVLRDGASAIYGADASAGAVNTLLRTNYEGVELSTRYGWTDRGGAGDIRFTLSGGKNFNDGRTNVIGMIDVYSREFLGTKHREFSSDSDARRTNPIPPAPWDGVPLTVGTSTVRDNDFDSRSTGSNYGNFQRGTIVNGEFVGARPTSNRGILTSGNPSSTLSLASDGSWFMVPVASGGVGAKRTSPSRNTDSPERDYFYNLNNHRTILPQSDRLNVYSAITHEFAQGGLTAFGELSYYRADSWLTRDPQGIDTDDAELYVGVDNPYNPFGSRFYHPSGTANSDGTPRLVGTPAPLAILSARPRELREKEIEVLSQSLRLVGGLRGTLWDSFSWESAALYSGAWTTDHEHFNLRDSRLRDALARSDANAFNPFGMLFYLDPGDSRIKIGDAYTNPDSVVDPLYDTFIRKGTTELATVDFKLSGELFEFWGGPVSIGTGLEMRYESYSDFRPPYHGFNPTSDNSANILQGDNDFIGLSPNINLDSDRTVWSGYAELLIPFTSPEKDIPGLHTLELSLAGRYEKFSDFGDAAKPKAGLAWRPTDWLLFRGSYNESFRAPNLVQTNTQPLQRSVTGVTDPYRFDVTSDILDGPTNRTVFRQGNDQLEPEEAEITTIGAAIEVPYVKGLTLTVDYWEIDQTQVIENLSASTQLARDRDALDAFTQAQLATGTAIGSINTNSGAASYVGNAKVTRAAVTDADRAAFAAYNATAPAGEQRAPVGRVISVIDDYLNLAGRRLAGYDFALSYRVPETVLGRFTIKAEATRLDYFEEQDEVGGEINPVLREDGVVEWRRSASLTWRKGNWRAGWYTTFYDDFMDTSAATTEAVYEALGRPDYIEVFVEPVSGVVRYRQKVESFMAHNANLTYHFDRNDGLLADATVRFGVSNLTDEEPPLADESRGYRGGTVSAKGRSFYLELTKKF